MTDSDQNVLNINTHIMYILINTHQYNTTPPPLRIQTPQDSTIIPRVKTPSTMTIQCYTTTWTGEQALGHFMLLATSGLAFIQWLHLETI